MFESLSKIINDARARGAKALNLDSLIALYLAGRAEGYLIHGVTQGLPKSVAPNQALNWIDEGTEHATEALERFETMLDDSETITDATVNAVGAVIAVASIWRGNDSSLSEVNDLSGAGFKEWVRTIGRANPRDWHDDLNGKILPFDDLYTLTGGRYKGMKVHGPRDWQRVRDSSEWAFCGHALILRNERQL